MRLESYNMLRRIYLSVSIVDPVATLGCFILWKSVDGVAVTGMSTERQLPKSRVNCLLLPTASVILLCLMYDDSILDRVQQ